MPLSCGSNKTHDRVTFLIAVQALVRMKPLNSNIYVASATKLFLETQNLFWWNGAYLLLLMTFCSNMMEKKIWRDHSDFPTKQQFFLAIVVSSWPAWGTHTGRYKEFCDLLLFWYPEKSIVFLGMLSYCRLKNVNVQRLLWKWMKIRIMNNEKPSRPCTHAWYVYWFTSSVLH